MSNIFIPKGSIIDSTSTLGTIVYTDGTGNMPVYTTPNPDFDWVKELYETNQEFKSQLDAYLANKNFNKDLSNLIKDEV